MDRPVDMEALRRFVAVARTLNFTRAAKQLGITQPALSRSVAALENDLGLSLLERTSRRVALTQDGETVLAEAQIAFEHIGRLRRIAIAPEVDVRGAMRIGATDSVATGLLPETLGRLIQRYPKIHPFVVVSPTSDLVRMVTEGDLDLALSFNAVRADLSITELGRFAFSIVVARDRRRAATTCERFIGSREVEDRTSHRFPALTLWRKTWPNAKIAVSSNSLSMQAAMIASGAVVGVLPEFMIADALAKKLLVRGSPAMNFPLLAYERRREGRNARVEVLLEALRESETPTSRPSGEFRPRG
jgi:DNA-binding transcriptional LysR family regulator